MTNNVLDEKEEKKEKGGLFEDLSLAQVIAGALAAVTSMLLSSQIGIAGSVIGVAIGSVVATVTSQIYKRFLSASAEKVKNLTTNDDATSVMSPYAGDTAYADRTAQMPQGTHTSQPAQMPQPARTAQMPQNARAGRYPQGYGAHSATPRIDDAAIAGTGVARARAERRHKKKVQKGVIIVAIVSALIAVALSALVINIATTGQGLGDKTPALTASDTTAQHSSSTYGSSSASTTKAVTSESSSTTTAQTEKSTSQNTATSESSSKSASSSSSSAASSSSSSSQTAIKSASSSSSAG